MNDIGRFKQVVEYSFVYSFFSTWIKIRCERTNKKEKRHCYPQETMWRNAKTCGEKKRIKIE